MTDDIYEIETRDSKRIERNLNHLQGELTFRNGDEFYTIYCCCVFQTHLYNAYHAWLEDSDQNINLLVTLFCEYDQSYIKIHKYPANKLRFPSYVKNRTVKGYFDQYRIYWTKEWNTGINTNDPIFLEIFEPLWDYLRIEFDDQKIDSM